MNRKDILTITTVALGTATLTVAAFWAGPIEAGNDADAPPAKITKARFVSRGVEMTLAPTDGRAFKAGDQPQFELAALNTTQQPASASVSIAMTASSPQDRMSRALRLPKVLWQQDQIVSLQPGERKTFALNAGATLPANSMIAVSLGEQRAKAARFAPGIVALSFSTLAPKPVATVAATR